MLVTLRGSSILLNLCFYTAIKRKDNSNAFFEELSSHVKHTQVITERLRLTTGLVQEKRYG